MTKSPETDEEMAALRVSGTVTPHDATIRLLPYDQEWALQFAAEARKIRAALREMAIVLEHVGSTSIPGLPAKPIIDVFTVGSSQITRMLAFRRSRVLEYKWGTGVGWHALGDAVTRSHPQAGAKTSIESLVLYASATSRQR